MRNVLNAVLRHPLTKNIFIGMALYGIHHTGIMLTFEELERIDLHLP